MLSLKTVLLGTLIVSCAFAQAPPAARPTPAAKVRPPAFPERPAADPAVVERGKAVFGVHCVFCHGADARGGSGGTNLIRAEVVMNDQNGELIGPIVRNGREGMPKFDLTSSQIVDVAAFIHSFKVGGYDISRMTPPSIVVGNAQAGEEYFGRNCAKCHSVTGDLKAIASRLTDPKALQQVWLMPSPLRTKVSPTTVTVTLAGGKKVEGRLVRIDDFFVALADADGFQRTFTRNGDVPKVELHDPLAPHRELLATYRDQDIHNVTAYLVTVK